MMKHLLKLFVLLIIFLQINNAAAGEDITGTWQGALEAAPGSELTIHFIIDNTDDGSYSVVLDSPDHGAVKDIKANSVSFDSGILNLEVDDLSGAYDGVLKDGKFEGNWIQEGTSLTLNLRPYEKPVLSREDMDKLAGSWYGPLEIPTGDLTLVFLFEIKENGEYQAFLDSPDQGAAGMPVSDVELVDGVLSLKISVANAEYKGRITGDEIVGEFKQAGQRIPLTLKKGEYKPEVSLSISKGIKDKLSGEWHGQLSTPGGIIHVSFRFETIGKEDFVGFFDVPEQNIRGIPINRADYIDGKLTLIIKAVNATFKGAVSGDMLTGEWIQTGLGNIPLTMKKGEYTDPVFSLDLSMEAKELLSGEWHGQRKMTKGFLHVLFRFETNDKGDFLGFYNLHEQNLSDLPVTDAILKDGTLVLKMQKDANIEFKGQLAGEKLTGQIIQTGIANTTLSMKKGKYIPPVYNLNLSGEAKELLSGEWYGEIRWPSSIATAVFKFETNEKGEFTGTRDLPEHKINGIPVTDANFSNGKMILIVSDAEYIGEIKGDEFNGEIILSAPNTPPVPFSLNKGQYIPPDYSLKLPGDVINSLSGKWYGMIGNYNLVLRFEKDKSDRLLGFLDNPDSNSMDIPISEGNMSEGKLVLKIKRANIEFKGRLLKDSIEGEWIQGGNNIPLKFEKK